MRKSILLASLAIFAILLTACGAKKGNTAEMLTANQWELFSMNGDRAEASNYNRELPNATFTTDSKVSGNGGCNRFSGPYTVDKDGNLSVGNLISTKMYCEGSREGEFMDLFSNATAARIEQDRLILLNGDKEVLVFVAKAK